jgi:hypothetical protein
MRLLLVGAVIVAGGVGYVGWRFLAGFDWRPRRRGLVWGALVALAALVAWFPLAWYVPVGLEGTRYEVARAWAVYGAMGLFLCLGLAFVARDAAWLAVRAAGRLVRRVGRGGGLAELDDPERRKLVLGLSSWGALGGAAALWGFGVAGARAGLRVVDVEVALRRLPAAFDGYRIVQISDLHVGNTIGRAFVVDVVRRVNELDADLVAITGDLTDGTVEMLRDRVAPLAGLRGRDGVFFVTGNHDYYFGDAVGWVAETNRLGMTCLVNEHRTVTRRGEAIVVAGVADFGAGWFVASHASDPAVALAGAPAETLKILLAHQPRSVANAAPLGVDLQLSGHTHGGQVIPFHLAARLTQPVLAGLHDIDGTTLYVSRGTGYWGPPLRLAAPAEITRLTLRRVA